MTSGHSISLIREEPVSYIYALRGPLHSNRFSFFGGGRGGGGSGKVKIDIFLALHDQSHALASLTRLPKSSKRKNEEEGLEGKFGPRLRL